MWPHLLHIQSGGLLDVALLASHPLTTLSSSPQPFSAAAINVATRESNSVSVNGTNIDRAFGKSSVDIFRLALTIAASK